MVLCKVFEMRINCVFCKVFEMSRLNPNMLKAIVFMRNNLCAHVKSACSVIMRFFEPQFT